MENVAKQKAEKVKLLIGDSDFQSFVIETIVFSFEFKFK